MAEMRWGGPFTGKDAEAGLPLHGQVGLDGLRLELAAEAAIRAKLSLPG